MDYALQLLIPFLLGLYAGHWLDERTGKGPLFLLLGSLVGMSLGIGILYKRALMAQKQREHDKTNDQEHP